MTNLCIRWERIANEILMHFRAQRKLQGEVSLSDTIETGPEGDALYLSDVVGEDDTMLEELQDKENRRLIRRLVAEVLTEREADIIRRRYGLDGRLPQTQKQVAALYGISRSYVSRIEKKALKKLEEALAALVMLGFAKTAAEKALRGILRENPGASVEDLVRMGLKSL
mgnify:CR=1 FL=1